MLRRRSCKKNVPLIVAGTMPLKVVFVPCNPQSLFYSSLILLKIITITEMLREYQVFPSADHLLLVPTPKFGDVLLWKKCWLFSSC